MGYRPGKALLGLSLARVNNSEQFFSDTIDCDLHRVLKDLCVDVQRRADIGMAHQFGDDFLGDAFVVRSGTIRPPEREPGCARQS